MVIFNTSLNKPQYYDGKSWYLFHNDHYIGELFGGGIVFYVDNSGKHGLIAAPSDQNNLAQWGFFKEELGANNKSLGSRKSNTEKISSTSEDNQIAARLCSKLTLNGYNDWYLPSMDELNLMYVNLKMAGLGNFSDDHYWTSSETDFNNAWQQDFKIGPQIERHVNRFGSVRPILAF